MSTFRKAAWLLFRLVLATITMSIAYTLGTTVIGQTSIILTPEEASRAVQALLIVSLVNALVLSHLILRSRWYGLKLMGAIALVHFGVETFMAQIETLYFNSALQMGTAEFIGIVRAGAIRAIIFAPFAVFFFGKLRRTANTEEEKAAALPTGWPIRFAALSVFYVVVYFMFGYFVAWQWADVRLFYSGTTSIKPFFVHFWDLFRTEPVILPFQLLRGALWTALATLIVRMMKAQAWETSLAVAMIFAVLLSSAIGLFPNPYMPEMVRRAHFYELSSSMLLFGAIVGWVLQRKRDREQ